MPFRHHTLDSEASLPVRGDAGATSAHAHFFISARVNPSHLVPSDSGCTHGTFVQASKKRLKMCLVAIAAPRIIRQGTVCMTALIFQSLAERTESRKEMIAMDGAHNEYLNTTWFFSHNNQLSTSLEYHHHQKT